MTDLVFRDSAAAIGEAELQSPAALIGFDPPAALRRPCLRSNGSIPALTAWELDSGEPLVVTEFLPLGPPEMGKRTVATTFEVLRQRDALKPGLVPFARDWAAIACVSMRPAPCIPAHWMPGVRSAARRRTSSIRRGCPSLRSMNSWQACRLARMMIFNYLHKEHKHALP